jgi:hypothetical protein
MFVRATTINADPARIDDGIAFVRDHVVPAVETLPGSLGLSMMVDRVSGTTTVSTAWETEAGRAAADGLLTTLRGKAMRIMGTGTPVTEYFELAVLDRLRPASDGFWNRMTYVTIDPAHLDDAVDAYASSTLHDLQLLPGYCSAVLLVDRIRGAGIVSLTFDSKASLEASREQAETIRRAAVEKTGARVSEIRESQVVIAGLRLPQTG